MTAQRDLAVIIANAAAVAQPADTSLSAEKKSRAWKQFIESFDWELIEKKANAKVDPIKAIMGALGTVVVKK